MSSSPDNGLRALFIRSLPAVHWQSIESGLTGSGIPDLNGCFGGVEFWVEMKATPEWWVDLKPEQVGWILRRRRAGGNCYIAVRRHCSRGPRRPAADELWLIHGDHAKLAKTAGLRGVANLGVWEGGPASWDWATVLSILTDQA